MHKFGYTTALSCPTHTRMPRGCSRAHPHRSTQTYSHRRMHATRMDSCLYNSASALQHTTLTILISAIANPSRDAQLAAVQTAPEHRRLDPNPTPHPSRTHHRHAPCHTRSPASAINTLLSMLCYHINALLSMLCYHINALLSMICYQCSAVNALLSMLCYQCSAINALLSMLCYQCSAINALLSMLCYQ